MPICAHCSREAGSFRQYGRRAATALKHGIECMKAPAAPLSLDYFMALLIVAPNGWNTSFVMDLIGEPPAG